MSPLRYRIQPNKLPYQQRPTTPPLSLDFPEKQFLQAISAEPVADEGSINTAEKKEKNVTGLINSGSDFGSTPGLEYFEEFLGLQRQIKLNAYSNHSPIANAAISATDPQTVAEPKASQMAVAAADTTPPCRSGGPEPRGGGDAGGEDKGCKTCVLR